MATQGKRVLAASAASAFFGCVLAWIWLGEIRFLWTAVVVFGLAAWLTGTLPNDQPREQRDE